MAADKGTRVATTARMTLEQFLAMPETEPESEFAHGIARPKYGGETAHSFLQTATGLELHQFAESTKLGYATFSLTCVFGPAGEQRVYIPDATFVAREHWPTSNEELNDYHSGILTSRSRCCRRMNHPATWRTRFSSTYGTAPSSSGSLIRLPKQSVSLRRMKMRDCSARATRWTAVICSQASASLWTGSSPRYTSNSNLDNGVAQGGWASWRGEGRGKLSVCNARPPATTCPCFAG